MASIIMQSRKKDGSAAPETKPDEVHPELMKASEDFLSGVHNKDATAVAKALQAAHSHLNSSPDPEDEQE